MTCHVYIMASMSGTLYVGVTTALEKRVYQHKNKLMKGFTARYNVNRLVYYESVRDIRVAFNREKEIKAWRREKKVKLIESMNRDWKDLAADWYG